MSSAPGDRVGIIAAGKTYLDVREALTTLGLDEAGLRRHGIRVLKLGMIWPLEPSIIGEFADGLDEIIVVEEKRAFLETSVKEILYARAARPAVHGKLDARGHSLFASTGELDADAVAAGLARALDRLEIDSVRAWRNQPLRERAQLPLLARSPYFCSGCPHNSSTKADSGALVGGGIGCHAMVLFMPPEQVGNVVGLTQMGGEGAQWIGMAPFVDEPHFIQNLGDGTFWHSGSLAVRASVAAGVNVTYKLLFNSAVAMTGGQDPVGGMSLPGLVRLLQAEGAAKIVVTSDDPARTKAGVAAAGGRDPPSRRRDRRAAGAGQGPGRDRADPRPGVRGREAAQAPPRQGGHAGREGHDQRADLRGLRRLRGEVQLPVGPPGRDRVRAEDANPPGVLQRRLLVP